MIPPEFRNRHGEKLDTSFHPGSHSSCLVLLGHGVTGNKDRPLLVAMAEGLSALGWPCLRLSFSGNGHSEGDFRRATISRESQDLRDLISALPASTRIAYIGHSMGGAVGVMTTAADPRIRVLVTLAGMIRTESFCEREFGGVTPDQGFMWDEPGYPLSRQYVDDMESIGDLFDEVGQISVPYLLFHGTADDVVLVEDSRDAFDTADEPKHYVEIPEAGHAFDDATYPLLVRETHAWLQQHLLS